MKTYRVATGSGSGGHKRMEGDKRTPEGEYRIDSRHVSGDYLRFLHVSYPNARDRKSFRKAKRSGALPNDARIGGAIGIHGEAKGYGGLSHKTVNWTDGCIAVDNDEILELYEAIHHNAKVVIHP